ncbi:mannose-binding protein c [Plakobranchus ocellatus]|uniref:Mannose-binding protein c n=1 Tax=Plakobranchus ocellatus TaxID=259542 RepID=A0AAV3YGW1_9GAST|nr:mannose-binding protein c [Plakobranchus ocellatus]
MLTVMVLFLALSHKCTADFIPGCSFVGGQCQYSVQLGHAGQCDSAGTGSGTRTGETSCCDDVKANLGTLRSDIDLLQSQVKGLMNDLTQAQGDLTQAQNRANQTEAARDALLATLQQKEAELNTTQKELANLIHRTGIEITALRTDLANMTTRADNCRAAIGLPPLDPTLSVSLAGPVSQTYCNFSSINKSPCTFQITQKTNNLFHLMTRGHNTDAGPEADHSQGTTQGTFLGLDAGRVASYNYGLTVTTVAAVSEELEPANSYCIFFYYSMVGKDVQTLELTIKIGGGSGYPVWTRQGQQRKDWVLAQVELDSEYTANPFSLHFLAKTKAYHRTSTYYYDSADIGIDDLYAYNTTCDNIPLCPVTAVHKNTVRNVTSCYTFHATAMTWQDAYYTCRKEGPWSGLVSVESQEEQDYLSGVIAADPGMFIVMTLAIMTMMIILAETQSYLSGVIAADPGMLIVMTVAITAMMIMLAQTQSYLSGVIAADPSMVIMMTFAIMAMMIMIAETQSYLSSVITAESTLNAAGQYGFFTSGNDIRTEHQFVWTDTGKARPVANLYENWHIGQPNNVGGAQDCLLLQYSRDDYSWGDVPCTDSRPFICEVSIPQ